MTNTSQYGRQSAGEAAQTRVITDEDPMLQAALEQLAVTYSIRTILIWTLVVVPVALVALGVILLIFLSR